jgi:hypothetical protein
METIISKRLASIIPLRNTEVKLNGQVYYAGIGISNYYIRETDKDYTLGFNISEEFNYFCFNKQNKITCWPTSKGDQPLTNEGQWVKEGRMELKAGRFLLLFEDYIRTRYGQSDDIENLLRQKIIARLCEIFTDKIRGSNEDISFDVSEEISEIYYTEEHESSGYLGNSCMRYKGEYGCREFARFYDLIPNLKILYKKILGKLLFRALLWENVTTYDGKKITFLDRIYSANHVNNQLIDYAKEHEWAWREFGSSNVHFENDSDVRIKCPISEEAFKYLQQNGSPYVDTLHKLGKCDGQWILSNYLYCDYSLQECDGQAVRERTLCSDCGEIIDEGDEMTDDNGDIFCSNCFNSLYTYCDGCDSYHSSDDVVCIGYLHRNYCTDCLHDKGFVLCDMCGEWTTTCTEVDGNYVCEDCLEIHYQECVICGDYFRKDRRTEGAIIILDGEAQPVCRDCLDNHDNNLYQCVDCNNYFTNESSIDKKGRCINCRPVAVSKQSKPITI